GWARGGGVYIAEYSSPTLIHCEIRNCSATGGSGGNGGGGGGGEESAGLGGLWTNDTDATWQALGYEGQYRFYSGYGGGVYCGQFSSPEFIACTISNNATQGGMSGIGGNAGDGTVQQPDVSYEIPSYGGGIYCAEKSDVTFEGCSITSNVAAKPSEVYHLSSSLGHGGGIAFESEASVSFSAYELSSGGKMECLIGENTASVGGGVYFAGADAWITDCNVINNLAFQGAGIYGANLFDIYGKARIQNCTIQNNFAGSVIIETPEPDDPTIGDVDIVAGQGAGIYCDSVPAQIVDNKFNNNVATASGGGIYITGATLADPNVINCLIVNNQAGRDGGGISANWHAAPRISSCTISDNEAVGDFGPISSSGVGGGLYCGYFAEAETIDSIFWNNAAALGRQIAVGSGFEFDPRPGVLTLSYSDVHGGLGEPATYVEGDPATMLPGSHDGVINADPLFATGSLGDYYLSQTAAGQSPQSPCVDAGSDFAIRLFASYRLYTTSTNDAFGAYDIGWVDMGYHYRFKETEHRCRHIDLVRDGVIRLEDFALVALHWMDDFCAYPGWCDGADTNADEYVDSDDLVTFARCWLVEDNEAPQPDPSVWLTKPYGVNGATGQIAMTAGESYDSWGWDVAYYFERLVGPIGDPGNPNSGWQWRGNTTNPTMWTDSGLTPYEQYSYVFKVGEVRADNGTNVTVIGNETQYAPKAFAIAGDEINPPQPNPSQWSLLPVSASATSITMAAVVATDFEGSGVEYYFENQTIVGEDHDSGWQDDPFYTDEGLTTGVLYTYRVVTRDKSYNQNQGSYSVSASAMPEEGAVTDTMPPYPTGGFAGDPGDPDAIPPIPYAPPDPPQWLSFYKQDSGQDTYLILEAVPATDTLSMPVQYMFVSKTSNHPSTGWLDVNIHAVLLSSWVEYGSFTIKYRDSALPVSNESVESEEWDTTMIP
ncbi:MAG: right-handed parallel beta-helix repeat-containing protein, partial [Planctomycetes bacterium]|nr:right-handed parallel beta-helix repeat-containing protein [Planctomycetota bacterium]